jgi:hypothetical protein
MIMVVIRAFPEWQGNNSNMMHKANHKRREALGSGAYERKLNGEEEPSTKDAQGHFLQTVRRLVPGIVDDLSGEPFSLYRQIPELCFDADKERVENFQRLNLYDKVRESFMWENYRRPAWENIETPFVNPLYDSSLAEDDERVLRAQFDQHFRGGVIDPTPTDKDGRIAAFRKSLIEWSLRHNLDEIWCRERAYNTLEEWSSKPEWLEQRNWKFQINYPHPFIAGGEPRFVFERRTQYPLSHFRKGDFELAVQEFKRAYSRFQDELDASFEAGGYTAAPIKPLDHHFEWLVKYHVQGWDYRKIAESYGIEDDSSLRHRVPEVARLIGLRLKNRKGRPRKL